MIWWIAAFVIMLAMPVLVALLYYGTQKGQVLKIRQDYVKDERYFGHSFSRMVEKALPEMKDGVLTLSKPEPVLEIGSEQTFDEPDIEKLVLVRDYVFWPKGENLNFHKEIYCSKDAVFAQEKMKFRAVYSKTRIIFGNETEVLRWADAEETVVVYDHCDLGRRISAGEQLIIGYDNKFSSLYAPVVRLGQRSYEPDRYMENRNPEIFSLPILRSYKYNRRYISEDMYSEEGMVPYTIVSRSDILVVDGVILQGDIQSDQSVRIMENATVLGNVFAEKDILLERNATVLGNVFTQGNIIFEEGACVGQPGQISSVIARDNIKFYGNNTVFGYILTEGEGMIMPNADFEYGEEPEPKYCFPERKKKGEAI